MAQIPKLMARLQSGLQFKTVPRRPGRPIRDLDQPEPIGTATTRAPNAAEARVPHQGQESLTVFSRTDRTVRTMASPRDTRQDADLPVRIPAHWPDALY